MKRIQFNINDLDTLCTSVYIRDLVKGDRVFLNSGSPELLVTQAFCGRVVVLTSDGQVLEEMPQRCFTFIEHGVKVNNYYTLDLGGSTVIKH